MEGVEAWKARRAVWQCFFGNMGGVSAVDGLVLQPSR